MGDGGCLSIPIDARAFAVAKVTPPQAAGSCTELCVVALHAPHLPITQGKDKVQAVCGALTDTCTVAFGDWNIDGSYVAHVWQTLIGSSLPSSAAPQPDDLSCCWPQQSFGG